jgi:hypothetical protein
LERTAQNPIDGNPFLRTPKGCLMHGSHSGKPLSRHAEFIATANYAVITPYAFHRTIGEDEVGRHLTWRQKGHHGRACSQTYLGFEFAQTGYGGVNEDITDAQVRAFCCEFMDARETWPDLPLHFPTHAEVDGTAEYGFYNDGKWDVFYKHEIDRANDLRARILARLASEYGVTS